MLKINAAPKSAARLYAQTNPVNANQPEAIPWVYFDTQSVATGSTGPISFFQTVSSDKTISNLEQAGTIPDPYYFEIVAFNFDFLSLPTIAIPGAANDLVNLLATSRATFVFSLAGKEYLRIPLTYLHCSGGANSQLSSNITAGAAVGSQYALNAWPDGGFLVDKAITLPPKQSFSAQIQLGAAVTLSATTNFRLSMAGVLHRRVL